MNKYNMQKIIKNYAGDQNSVVYTFYNIKNVRDISGRLQLNLSGRGQLYQYHTFTNNYQICNE